jgi:hypothetical protein
MKNLIISFCIFFIFVSSLFAEDDDEREIYYNLRRLGLDENRNAKVEGLTIHRDAATFILNEGKIVFFQPVDIWGDTCVTGALFLGDGIFTFKPATSFEKIPLL